MAFTNLTHLSAQSVTCLPDTSLSPTPLSLTLDDVRHDTGGVLGEQIARFLNVSDGDVTGLAEFLAHPVSASVEEESATPVVGYPDDVQNALTAVAPVIPEKTPEDPMQYPVSLSQIIQQDVTGEDSDELIIFVNVFTGYRWYGAVLVYTCDTTGYHLMDYVNTFTDYNFVMNYDREEDDLLGMPEVYGIMDLTGNDIPEIVITATPLVGNDGWISTVEIVEWNGEQLVYQTPPSDRVSHSFEWSNISGWRVLDIIDDIIDVDNDGIPEIYVASGSTYGEFLDRPVQEIWKWDGTLINRQCTRPTNEPNFRFEALESGDANLYCGLFGEAVAFYTDAIQRENFMAWRTDCVIGVGYPYDCQFRWDRADAEFDPDEDARLVTFAYYRLMLVHLLLDNPDEAKAQFDLLMAHVSQTQDSAAGGYAEMANILWTAYQSSQDIAAACQQVTAYALDNQEMLFREPGIYYRGEPLHESYFSRFVEVPENICPINQPFHVLE